MFYIYVCMYMYLNRDADYRMQMNIQLNKEAGLALCRSSLCKGAVFNS